MITQQSQVKKDGRPHFEIDLTWKNCVTQAEYFDNGYLIRARDKLTALREAQRIEREIAGVPKTLEYLTCFCRKVNKEYYEFIF